MDENDRRPPLKGWELAWMLLGILAFASIALMLIYPEQFRAFVWGLA